MHPLLSPAHLLFWLPLLQAGSHSTEAGKVFCPGCSTSSSHSHGRAYGTRELCATAQPTYAASSSHAAAPHCQKPAGVCTDSFNHLLIACTFTVLTHLEVTNTALPLSSTPFQSIGSASAMFATAAQKNQVLNIK